MTRGWNSIHPPITPRPLFFNLVLPQFQNPAWRMAHGAERGERGAWQPDSCRQAFDFTVLRYALCSTRSALHALRFALCALHFTLCAMRHAPCAMLHALCASCFLRLDLQRGQALGQLHQDAEAGFDVGVAHGAHHAEQADALGTGKIHRGRDFRGLVQEFK